MSWVAVTVAVAVAKQIEMKDPVFRIKSDIYSILSEIMDDEELTHIRLKRVIPKVKNMKILEETRDKWVEYQHNDKMMRPAVLMLGKLENVND